MEPIKIIISAEYSEFKTFLENYLFKLYKSHAGKPQEYERGGGLFTLQYPFLGSLIVYKILVIEDSLDIEISVPVNCDENSEIHINEIVKEIRKNFPSASFPFRFKNLILNIEHSEIMENLWIESIKTQKAKAHLSTIVLLGSILEGLLFYKITKSSENKKKAGGCKGSPKDSRKKVLPFEKWTLNDMIVISYKCGWINEYSYNYSDALRKHRNFVHPFLQLEENFSMPDENACDMSRIALKAIFDDLLKTEIDET